MGEVMKIEAGTLKAALAAVRPAVDAKGASPLMGYVHIEVFGGVVAVTADRGTVAIRATCPGAEDGASGIFVAPHDRLSQIVSLYDGETLALSYKGGSRRALTIRAKRAEHVVTCVDPDGWPPPVWLAAGSREEQPVPLVLAAPGWVHVLSAATYASQDVNRQGLNGLCFERVGDGETLRGVATDGSRLCWRSAQAEPTIPISGAILPTNALIPREMALILGKSAAAAGADSLFALAVGRRVAVWSQVDADGREIGSLRVRFALVEGEFPGYRLVLPESVKRTITLSTDDLSAVLRSVAVSATDKNASIRCSFEEGRLLLRAQDSGARGGEARAEVPAEMDGSPVETGFNARFVDEALRGAGRSVTLHMGDALDPSLWLAEVWRPRSGALADVADMVVIMPMRLD